MSGVQREALLMAQELVVRGYPPLQAAYVACEAFALTDVAVRRWLDQQVLALNEASAAVC